MDCHRLSKLVVKLGHRLAEVRSRALKALLSELRNETISCEALLNDDSFVSQLLRHIQGVECDNQELRIILDLISELLSFPNARRQFFEADLECILNQMLLHFEDVSIRAKIQGSLSQLLHLPFEASNVDSYIETRENIPPILTKSTFSVRNERLEARKEWNRQEQRYSTIQDILNLQRDPDTFAARLLQSIEIPAHDDQMLFEIGLKLRFGADPEQVVKALEELCSLLHDLSPQIFIQKKTIPKAVIDLVRSGVQDSVITQLGLKFLRDLVTKLESHLWTALNQELHTHCEDTEKRVLCHERSPGCAIGVDVVAFCAEICRELIDIMIEGVDPLVEFLTLAESVVFIFLHPFCLDREGKTHPVLENSINKLVLHLNKILHLSVPNGEDVVALDIRMLAVASSVLKLLTKTRAIVQIKIEIVAPPLLALSNNFISRCLLPCLAELWKHYNPRVPESSSFRKALEEEAEIEGVIQALDKTNDILKENCCDAHWIDSFSDIKAALDWCKEPVCKHIIEEIDQLILTTSDDSNLEKATGILKSLLREFSSDVTLEALRSIRTLLKQTPITKTSEWMFKILFSPEVVETVFSKLVFVPELKSVIVELLKLMWQQNSELFLKSIASWIWFLACFQQDPVFTDLLLELPKETFVHLSILNLWNKDDKTRHFACFKLWDFLCSLQALKDLDLHFTGNPFEGLPKAKHPNFTPLVFAVSCSDLEALIGIVLNNSEDIALVQTSIKRIQRAAMTHLESLEDSKSFQQFITKLLQLLLRSQSSRSCGMEGIFVILQTLHWLVKNSTIGLEHLRSLFIKDLLPLPCLAFHTDVNVRAYVLEICCAVFWYPSISSSDSVKNLVFGRIKSHFSVPCLVFDEHDSEGVARSRQHSKVEWILKGREALKETGSLLDLLKQWSSCEPSLDGGSKKTLEALFRPLILLESNPDIHSSLETWTELRLLIHCVRDLESDVESDIGIKRAIQHQLEPLVSLRNNTSFFLLFGIVKALLQSSPMDQGEADIAVKLGYRMLIPLLESEQSSSLIGSKMFLLDALISLVQFSTALLSCTQQPGSDILSTERYNTDIRHPVMVISKWMSTQIQNTQQRSILLAPLVSLMLQVAKHVQNAMVLSDREDFSESTIDLWSSIPTLISTIFLPPVKEGRSCNSGTRLSFLQTLDILLGLKYGDNDLWSEDLGCAWLSKLTRETDVQIREATFRILVHLCRPLSISTLNQIFQFWPEILSKLVHTGMNKQEAFSVRSTALNALLQLLSGYQGSSQDSQIRSFVCSLLQDQDFWTQVRNYALENRSLSLKSASLGLLLVGMDLDSCVKSETLSMDDLVETCHCKDLKDSSWMDIHQTRSKIQRLLHSALSASTALILLMKCNQDSPLCYQQAAFSGLRTLLEYDCTFKDSFEAFEKLLFFQSLHGMLRSVRSLKSSERSLSSIDKSSSPSFCQLLISLLRQMQGLESNSTSRSNLTLLSARLLSTEESCSHFILSDSEGVELLKLLVFQLKSVDDQEQESTSMALKNLLAFNSAAKNAFLVMDLHKEVIQRLTHDKPRINSISRTSLICSNLAILRHLVINHSATSEALLEEDILSIMLRDWCFIRSDFQIRSEALKLIKNIFISKPTELLNQLVKSKQSCSFLKALIKELNTTQVDAQILDLFTVFACEAKGTQLLLKNGLIDKLKELLHFIIGNQKDSICAAIYKVLAALSSHEIGRSALMTPSHGKEILKLTFRILNTNDTQCRCSCYLFLRNLSFSTKLANHVLSQNGSLQQICEEIHPFRKESCTSMEFQTATHALTVLWILVSHGEQAKGVIKSLVDWKKTSKSVQKRLEDALEYPETSQDLIQPQKDFLHCLNSFIFVMGS